MVPDRRDAGTDSQRHDEHQLRASHPEANIIAVDYDPGASEVNQLNRIKLMLSTAQKNLSEGKKDSRIG